MTEFQRTMALLIILATFIFVLVVMMTVSPKARSKFLEYFPNLRGRNGKPLTGKEVTGLAVMAILIIIVLLI